ncbi:MAG: Gldg family protein [Desulfobacterales bacterium]|nr:Gldg family protein [Desulfobacterales bacterium]
MKNRSEKYMKLFIYLTAIVLINLAGMTLFFRIDLTKNKIYSISNASKNVASSLSEPLTINVFFTKNLPAPHNNTERYLHDLLEEYAIHANKYFNYRFYDVSPEGEGQKPGAIENQKLADNYGIHPVQIQAVEQDEVKFKKAYMGLVLIHGDIIERIPTITSTYALEYKLTTAIQKLSNKISALLSLPGKIKIKLFLSSSLKQVAPYMGLNELSDYPDQLKEIIAKLNDKTYGKLEYTYIDPTVEQISESELKKYNIMSLKWPALGDGKVQSGSGVIGLVMEYADKVMELPLLKVLRIPIIGTQYDLVDINQMEETINDNLEALVDINEDLGYLSDHGTLKMADFSPMGMQDEDSLSSFSTLASQNYSIKHINLKDGSIPDSLQCLVIARPTEKFSDYELYQIDQALMRGTNLALFIDAFEEIMPSNQQPFGYNQGPSFVPLDTGLEKLLDHYGIRIKKSFVLDENCFKQRLQRQLGGGERAIYFAPIIKNKNITNDFDFMKNIKGLVAIKMSPLELDEKRIAENKLKAIKLFASSEKSWEMTGRINLNPMFINPPVSDAEKGSLPLAYMLTGEFSSYFAGKPMPEKTSEDTDSQIEDEKEKAEVKPKQKPDIDLSKIEEKGGFLSKGRPSKIFLMASSEMLKDNVLDPAGESPNDMFIMNILDALNNREDIAAMRSKEQRFNPLDDTGGLTKTFTKTFNIAGLPVLVVFFGFFVWLRRRSRKKQIQMIFKKQR